MHLPLWADAGGHAQSWHCHTVALFELQSACDALQTHTTRTPAQMKAFRNSWLLPHHAEAGCHRAWVAWAPCSPCARPAPSVATCCLHCKAPVAAGAACSQPARLCCMPPRCATRRRSEHAPGAQSSKAVLPPAAPRPSPEPATAWVPPSSLLLRPPGWRQWKTHT